MGSRGNGQLRKEQDKSTEEPWGRGAMGDSRKKQFDSMEEPRVQGASSY